MRIAAYVTVIIRRDDHDPLDPPPESVDDYREEHRLFWAEFNCCLARAGITPAQAPPPGWWSVEAMYVFELADVPRVMDWLRDQGAHANEHGATGKENGQ